MRISRRPIAFLAGLLASLALLPLLLSAVGRGGSSPAAERASFAENSPILIPGGAPFLEAARVSLDQAIAQTPYGMGIPLGSGTSGPWNKIWIDDTNQVAFVWDSGLELYQEDLSSAITEDELVDGWNHKAAQERDAATDQSHLLISIDGNPGIGHDKNQKGPSNLTWVEDGVLLQLFSPTHSFAELKAIAEEMWFE